MSIDQFHSFDETPLSGNMFSGSTCGNMTHAYSCNVEKRGVHRDARAKFTGSERFEALTAMQR